MTGIAVDAADPTPPFEQIRRAIIEHIRTGALPPDTRLAPIRYLAKDLGIAPGTVARAYKELEAEGVVTTARGGGTRVASPIPTMVFDAVPPLTEPAPVGPTAEAAGPTPARSAAALLDLDRLPALARQQLTAAARAHGVSVQEEALARIVASFQEITAEP